MRWMDPIRRWSMMKLMIPPHVSHGGEPPTPAAFIYCLLLRTDTVELFKMK